MDIPDNQTEKQTVSVHIPEEAKPTYSNTTQIAVSNDAVVMQFAYVRPNTTTGQLIAEIVMSPKQAIEYSKALDNTLKQHFTRHLEA